MDFDTVPLDKHILREISSDPKFITRFPPEPSAPGLHIGHCRPFYLLNSLAKKLNGECIIRFDDTNPSQECQEYEDGQLKDMIDMLGCSPNAIIHTSDYFDILIDKARELIGKDYAYVDDSTNQEIKEQRKNLIPSPYRGRTTDVNQKLFQEMLNGKSTSVLRLKVDYETRNKAMFDPVLYRCSECSHYRCGDKYKVYPTYDFSAPIVDSVEGITHIFRSIEYREREEQMGFILSKLGLPIPKAYVYGRLEIEGGELSKRKILSGIADGKYSSWDDPKLFTYQALRKRGISSKAIGECIAELGYSFANITLSPTKLYVKNKEIIDKIAIRICILDIDAVCVEVEGTYRNEIMNFFRNPNLGKRELKVENLIYLESADFTNSQTQKTTLLFSTNVDWDGKKYIIDSSTTHKDTELKVIWLCDPMTITLKSYEQSSTREVYCDRVVGEFPDGTYFQGLKKGYYVKQGECLVEVPIK